MCEKIAPISGGTPRHRGKDLAGSIETGLTVPGFSNKHLTRKVPERVRSERHECV